MQTYEYRFVEVASGKIKSVNGERLPYSGNPAAHDYANELGAAGWRVVGVASASSYAYTLIFIRAANDDPAPPADATQTDEEAFLDFLDADLESDLLNDA